MRSLILPDDEAMYSDLGLLDLVLFTKQWSLDLPTKFVLSCLAEAAVLAVTRPLQASLELD